MVLLIFILTTSFFIVPAIGQEEKFWTTFTNGNNIKDIQKIGDTLWAATDGGVVRWDTNICEHEKFTNTEGLPSNNVKTIDVNTVETETGDTLRISVGTDKGVANFDGSTNTFKAVDLKDKGSTSNMVSTSYSVSHGNLWYGTSGGVSQFDGENRLTFTTDDGLGSDYVTSITENEYDNIWVGTEDGGVNRYDGDDWTAYTDEDLYTASGITVLVEGPFGFLFEVPLTEHYLRQYLIA